ncbi:MAG: PAS domain-containing protein, partial [Candidatus Baltobacteraceae bacterium]
MEARMFREAISSLFADTPDAIILYDRDGVVVGANAAAQTLGGYAVGEMTGTTFRDHVAPRDVERVELAVNTALAGGTDHFDTSARHKDGSTIPVECYVFAA